MEKIQLPPLPPMKLTMAGGPGIDRHYYTAEQMRQYALDAIAAVQKAAQTEGK